MKTEETSTKNKLQFSLDLRVIIGALLLVIVIMLLMWRPWSSGTSDNRTVTVTGEATVKAEPDQYMFYPAYNFKVLDKTVALDQIAKKSDEVTSELKKLGVAENNIKTNSSGYDDAIARKPDSDTVYYTLNITITVSNKELAQKVQDYLIKTSPTGSITPQPTFSDAKRKELENQARDAATKDARSKADQSAKNLGFRVGKVKSVTDGTGFDIMTLEGRGSAEPAVAPDGKSSLTLHPGENELNYSVSVIYFVK